MVSGEAGNRTNGITGPVARTRVGYPRKRVGWCGGLATGVGWARIAAVGNMIGSLGSEPAWFKADLHLVETNRVTEQEIESKVIDIVANQLGAEKAGISRETSFVEDLNADSLDTVELVMEFEDEFETSIPDDKAEQIRTVGQAIDFIKQAHGVE